MDFFDPIVIPDSGRNRPAGDHVAQILGFLVFPCIDFLVVSAEHPIEGPHRGTILPWVFAAATFVIGRLLKGNLLFVVLMSLVCLGTCFLATGAGAFMGMF